ncbi:MAG: MFS transporter [SAR202 cluster bacterium]|nr:MFS transporter [SAR202 cluster bacterium]MDP7413105.1 MFS transporter [SAR202 cluster bacterium]
MSTEPTNIDSSHALNQVSVFVADYVARTREFSRNANLYVLHVIGMDMIHGSFTVLFNLYLLALGFDVRFVGLRLTIGFMATAVTAVPAGFVSDRIGRKASFILGDGVGAIIALIMIHTRSEPILLAGPAFVAFFNNLHHTSEAAFMAENSQPSERVHLFSVAGSFRTMSAMAGALMAGLLPLLFIDDFGKVNAYRFATYAGLTLWFLSLAPALMLRSFEAVERPELESSPKFRPRGWRRLTADIKHPRRIAYFVLTSAIIAIGTAAVFPLLNVVFHEGHVHADEGEIGILFAIAELSLAVVTLLVPLLATRMYKVDAIAATRMMAIPFVVAMGLLPLAFGEGSTLLALMGAAHVGRTAVFRMSFPLDDAFNMSVLEPRERATSTGIEIAAGSAVSAVAIFVSSRVMDTGDFATPFMVMALAYLVSTMIYWKVFRPIELEYEEEELEADESVDREIAEGERAD